MIQFYDTDAEIVCRGASDYRFVRYNGMQADYYKVEKFFFDMCKEEGVPLTTLTLMDASRAHNEDIIAYIEEIGKRIW